MGEEEDTHLGGLDPLPFTPLLPQDTASEFSVYAGSPAPITARVQVGLASPFRKKARKKLYTPLLSVLFPQD